MIPLFKVAMNPTADKAVGKVLSSGFIGQGEVVEKFELDLKICFNNPHIVTVNSGTSALTLALRIIKDKHPEKEIHYFNPFDLHGDQLGNFSGWL
jgi:dTDP-4-amino-4,6-dideoxygalactose transaminase